MEYKTKTSFFGKKKRTWFCVSCEKEYDVPDDVEDVREAVEKLVEAHFRRKKD